MRNLFWELEKVPSLSDCQVDRGVKRLIFLKRKKTVQAKTGSGEFHRMANIAEKEKTSPSKNRFWRNEQGGKTVEAKTGSG